MQRNYTRKMQRLLISVMIVCGAGIAQSRPQFNQYNTQTSISRGGLSVNCQPQEVSRGVIKYNCAGVNPEAITLRASHTLWLRGRDGSVQKLDIVVPNYRIEELIRAALKSGVAEGSTNVNILLKRPETIYDVQAQDTPSGPAAKPVVNLQYEEIPRPVSIHYPTEQAYKPLTGPIREP